MENEQRPSAWRVGDLMDQNSEVRGILGEGGMGTVYKVSYRPWKKELAVKRPRPELFARADGKANFIQEAETWTALGAYPHIVQGSFVSVINGIPHVFAEYVSGGSLADWIEQRRLYAGGPEQALSRILDIAIQFAWGLHFAHERGLVHQDVKPANVMMTAEGTAKVTDFGLARARLLAGEGASPLGSGKQSLLVSSRGMTPAYCSPEQAAGHPLTRRTDLWSWGLSVLEMFVGAVSWRVGVVAREALASYQREDPALPEMPAEVIAVLERCFQQEPAARPATMLEMASELQQIYAQCVGHPYPRVMPQPAEQDVAFFVNRGISLSELGRQEEALAALDQALRLNPDYALAHNNRGNVLRELRRRKEALAAYEQALRLNPDYALAHTNRGNVLRDLGRREEALAAYEQALRLNPDDALAHYNRGVWLKDLGQREEALAALEQALRLNPNRANAHYHRGLVLRQLGRPEEALASYEQALRLNPNDTDTYTGRGNVLSELGRREEALASYEQALRLNPDHADTYTGRGNVLRQMGRPEEALASYEQALRLNPNHAEAHSNRGFILYDLGRREDRQGLDLKCNLTITFKEAAQGCQKEVLVTQELACAVCQGTGAKPGTSVDTCPTCKGTREVKSVQKTSFGNFTNTTACKTCQGTGRLVKKRCSACKGKGREEKQKRLLVNIPAGVKDGTHVRIIGQGHAGWGKGAPGNLYVILKVR